MTAVMRLADAVLHAEIITSSSIRWSLTSGGDGDWMMKTSSSRTDWWICTEVSSERNLETWQGVRGMPRLWIEQQVEAATAAEAALQCDPGVFEYRGQVRP